MRIDSRSKSARKVRHRKGDNQRWQHHHDSHLEELERAYLNAFAPECARPQKRSKRPGITENDGRFIGMQMECTEEAYPKRKRGRAFRAAFSRDCPI
ncbi:hypothetical protein [Paraburkholderia sp. BL23I1N1]|uniref:hypothetical protein n=1 Tax=Paraburkholderia sp. BL23I1N1 TaxID=1938802 RepID=UPI0011C3DC43|nr:hypothetical protein [Paraburkholderia sp. BL23I1N1]